MRKIYLLLTVFVASVAFTSCSDSKKTESSSQETEEEQVDYAALVEKEFPSIDAFFKLVDNFQQATADTFSGRNPWQECRAACDTVIKPKGFTIVPEDKNDPFFVAATKNCTVDTSNGSFEAGIVPQDSAQLAAAIMFNPCGDMYDKGSIVVNDSNVYNALIDKVKAGGYVLTDEHPFAEQGKEIYVKDVYFFIGNKDAKRLELHYDFMKAQEKKFGNQD